MIDSGMPFLIGAPGCLGGGLGSIVSAGCEAGFCDGQMDACDFYAALVNTVIGCIGGGSVDTGTEEQVTWLLRALGLNVGTWGSMCTGGGPRPQLGKACCTFRNYSGDVWQETLNCPLGVPAFRCCRDRAEGWFVTWGVVNARLGQCRSGRMRVAAQ